MTIMRGTLNDAPKIEQIVVGNSVAKWSINSIPDSSAVNQAAEPAPSALLTNTIVVSRSNFESADVNIWLLSSCVGYGKGMYSQGRELNTTETLGIDQQASDDLKTIFSEFSGVTSQGDCAYEAFADQKALNCYDGHCQTNFATC